MSIIQDLQWRHAAKAYRTDKHVSTEDLNRIIEAFSLAPTSSGLQPFEIFVIASDEAKEKIAQTCYLSNAEYVRDSSYTILVAGWDNYTEARINGVYDRFRESRRPLTQRLHAYAQGLVDGYVKGKTESENFAHIARQAYIAIGMALTEAASLRIDTTPMEGFYNDQADELFDLRAKGLKSLCLIAVGYANEDKDWNAKFPKVRKPITQLATTL